MCVCVAVIGNGRKVYCETVGELAEALNLPCEKVSPDPANFCLCNATPDELGARPATESDGSPFVDYVIEIQQ